MTRLITMTRMAAATGAIAIGGCSAGMVTSEARAHTARRALHALSPSTRAPHRGRRANGAAAGAPAGGAALALITEPTAGDAPFVSMIDAARVSVQMTMYELSDERIELALVDAERRGVDVQVLLNRGYYSEVSDTNAAVYTHLHSHGVDVRWAPDYFALTHQKTLTEDGRESAIMTLNLTSTNDTRDFAIVDSRPADVHAIQATFAADFAHRRLTPSQGTGDLVWSPGGAPAVLALIDGARSSIQLENEEMAYAPTTDALCTAARRQVDVRVVMTYSDDAAGALERLAHCGVHIHLLHGQRPLYIHAKLLLVDGAVGLVGSQNLSSTSLKYNRELGIRVTAPAILRSLRRTFASDYALAAAL
jgi:cardiolipin synthase A/B